MWLQSLAAELAITMADGTVWLSIGQGLLVGAVCLLFGIWVARLVGLLEPDAPAGEAIGVGLASGLLVLAAWWAAVWSGGRSSFTPVAVGFGIAIVLAVVQRVRARRDVDAEPDAVMAPEARSARRRHLVIGVLGSAVFVVAVALLYGSTLTLSPRDGLQPIEFQDTAFYSILGADLARTGTETLYSPSGFAALEGLPIQTWYHWGELWLASAVITIFGMAPLDARHFVVLPILLLAAAAMTGTVVRRMTRSSSRGAFLFGFLACLFLAPVPVIQAGHFSSWAVGQVFGITMYGVAAVAALLTLYGLAVLGRRRATWALAVFAGTAAALLVPAHIVVAALGLVGLGTVWVVRILRSLVATRRLPLVAPVWRQVYVVAGAAILATTVWGLITGHGVGGGGASPTVAPFNDTWRDAMAIVMLGAGAFLAIAVAWALVREEAPIEADLYLGTAALAFVGALLWGARLADFNSMHLFYGGIATFVTPAAAVAMWSIWLRTNATGYARLTFVAVGLCILQIEISSILTVARLQKFGPGTYPPVPVEVLTLVRSLPPDAKVAYACRPLEELSFWNSRLLGLDAHTGRRIVPMCFQADFFAHMIGGQLSADILSPNFQRAPQRSLYPEAGASPSAADVASFMKANGIHYIYEDALHPNALVPGAIEIVTSGQTRVLRIP